ncbi:MAG: LuxR C-terminal-related transcriptional regulator [Anaerolineales bacterium]
MSDISKSPMVEPLSQREREIIDLLADGLTNREIADRLFLSYETVKWYNKQLFGKLGVSNRTQAAAKAQELGLQGDQQPAPAFRATHLKHNLPAPLTSFVGRRHELDEVASLLETSRLLTLTGPAGTGKTRLALQVAAQVLDDFADGVYLVELAPLKDPELVADTVARSLGVITTSEQPIATVLANYLESKELILVLDNFEHLLEAAPLVGSLLSAASDLRFLVTSREALNLYGEQEYPVPPLGLPDLSDPVSPSALADYEAATLFIQRAQAIRPDFSLTEEDASGVAEICVRLDGLPLAIELAAAQVKLFSPQALLSQLESRFTALKDGPRGLPERQRTLRGAIDWSYELLDDAEQTLFARLSVFQGGRTIEGVGAVCCHDLQIDVLDGLASLLNKNLLRQEDGPDGEPRFTMLETIHEYARERLQDSGDAEEIHLRHAEYFTALAERAEPYMRGGREQMRWLRRMEADHDNLRAMYKWSMDGGAVELGLRLVGALGYFWWRQGHYSEGQQWTASALEVIEGVSLAVRASVYSTAGRVYFYLDEPAAGKRALNAALALYEELGSRRELGWAHIHLMMPLAGRPDEFEEAMANFDQGLALLREADDKAGIAQAFTNLGEQARLQGDLPRAIEAYEKARKIAREIGDGLRESLLLINLGFIALHENDAEGAQAMLKESLTLALAIEHTAYTADKLSALAGAAVALGQSERAARLIGAADALFEKQSYIPQAGDLPEFERYEAAAREALDEVAFETAWAEGRTMSLDEAIAYALEEPASD